MWDGTTAFDFKLSLELGGGLRANGAARAHEALERHGRERRGSSIFSERRLSSRRGRCREGTNARGSRG